MYRNSWASAPLPQQQSSTVCTRPIPAPKAPEGHIEARPAIVNLSFIFQPCPIKDRIRESKAFQSIQWTLLGHLGKGEGEVLRSPPHLSVGITNDLLSNTYTLSLLCFYYILNKTLKMLTYQKYTRGKRNSMDVTPY